MKKGLLTGNQLKIIALIAMTLDHIGRVFFPGGQVLFVVGRLAYPLFAYFIAEGCRYTKNRPRYFLMVFGVGFLCQLVYFFAENSLYQCILITFSMSIAVIFSVDNALKNKRLKNTALAMVVILSAFFVCEVLPEILKGTNFVVDYGFLGVIFPAFIYFAESRAYKILVSAFGLVVMSLVFGGIQWFSLVSIPLIALYNGKRGKYRLKYLFYLYYPLHLAVIYLISMTIFS